MPFIFGFGQRVTGGGDAPEEVLEVNKGDTSGPGSLAQAILDATTLSGTGKSTKIVINAGITVQPRTTPLEISAKNLTITGEGSLIFRNELSFKGADNIILLGLTFDGTPDSEDPPRDTIEIDATTARGPVGYWIDHCHFEAYKDLNITVNTKDAPAGQTLPPLLISISNCIFHNVNPNGNEHRDNGALGIHGFRNKNDRTNTQRDLSTNAYATVYRNVFTTVRRRSPRSTNLTVVHAYNNVLQEWGAANTTDQVNGMEAGNFGTLVAQANYFRAGPLPQAITVAGGGQPGNLTVNETDPVLRNVYVDGAIPATSSGTQIDINAEYTNMGLKPPKVDAMTDTHRLAVTLGAGAQLTKPARPAPPRPT
jgi:hypothetical protein